MSDKAYYIAQSAIVVAIILLSMSASGCEVIGGIFKAGIWVGVIGVVVLVLAIVGIGRAMRK